jgi:hypothetical protein
VTPTVLMLIYIGAYLVRPYTTDQFNRKYFIPALTVRVVGALAIGFLYQLYYKGGDTFNFHTHGSRHIWEAFMDSPIKGLQMVFGSTETEIGIYEYSSRIPFFHDSSSYTIIRIAGFIDVFTLSTYSATALFFAVFSFIGSWMMFLTFYRERPHLMKGIAFATLFVPSVFFWGSGLLKDTVTLACLGVSTYHIKEIFIHRRMNIVAIIIMLLSLYIIYAIKKYILLCFLPATILWIYSRYLTSIRSILTKIILFPFMLFFIVASSYLAIMKVGKDDARYNLSKIGETAKITAYDIAYQTGRDAGSTYTLGKLDGSIGGMLKLAPQAINVSLFRPYIWEVRNPLMVMSALESFTLLLFTLYVIYKNRASFLKSAFNPDVLFCFVFSITFAFAVGISTFNFGTLSRYKIPLLTFYLLALLFMRDSAKRERNNSAFDLTE